MKIIHVLPLANFVVSRSFIKFIIENFNINQHYFVFLSSKKEDIPVDYTKTKNVLICRPEEFLSIIKGYDKIILHSLFITPLNKIRLLFNNNLMNKIIWVAWGADLYQWEMKLNGNILNKLKIKISNNIDLILRRRVKNFAGIFPPDIDLFKKEFNCNANIFYASYVISLYNSLYTKKISQKHITKKIENKECINIQIGHSSSEILKHLDVLKMLEKYKNENVNIYIPLSYGNTRYGDKVQKKANEIFGDKAICIREMIPKDDYMEYLTNIDIAIFNTTRQIGLGNINPLLFMGKKLFIPKGSVMYDYFKSQDIDIRDYNKISHLEYSEFLEPINYNGGRNYIINNELNVEHKIEMWRNVFEATLK